MHDEGEKSEVTPKLFYQQFFSPAAVKIIEYTKLNIIILLVNL